MASRNFPVAVIGMAVRLPTVETCDKFWSMIINSEKSVGCFPIMRAIDIEHVLQLFTSELVNKDEPFFTGSYFEEVDKFDPNIFQIGEKEALYIEPEQRIFLETVWEVLEDAGYISKIRGSKTGVYVGNTVNKYKYILTDNHPSISHGNPSISTHVSYEFDLKGPAMIAATGYSSSLLSVHLACQGLLSGDCDAAIAGGITLDLLPISTHADIWNQLGVTDDSLKCRPLIDSSAKGTAKGEGCGAVMLKPLNMALRDGDYIYGVLEATTADQDEDSASHLGAQTNMLVQAWQLASIMPDKLCYIEAHGTGTELEISGVTNAFEKCGYTFNCQSTKIPIGSVKANVGHLADGVAGVVGLIKVLLCYQHLRIPPMVNYNKEPDAHINWPASPVFVNTTPCNLEPREKGAPIYIGVSAFGLLGTNVHTVVKGAAQDIIDAEYHDCDDHNEIHFIALAANTKWSLCEFAKKMRCYFESQASDCRSCIKLQNVCYTINTTREQVSFKQHRAIAYGKNWDEVSQSLKSLHLSVEGAQYQVTGGFVTSYENTKQNIEFILSTGEKGQMILPFIYGKSISWVQYYCQNGKGLKRVPQLPTYAFERIRYWPKSTAAPLNANYLSLEYGTNTTPKNLEGLKTETPLTADFINCTLQEALNDALNLDLDWNEHAEESLFSYGLDSLISTHINMFIEMKLGCTFSLKGFHRNPTFQGIKIMIEEELKSGDMESEALLPAKQIQSLNINSASFTPRDDKLDTREENLPAALLDDELLQYRRSQKFAIDEEFWKSCFTTLPPNISLAIMPETESPWSNSAVPYESQHTTVSIPLQDKFLIEGYCDHLRITSYCYYLACTALVLHRYLGTDILTLAIPVTLQTDTNRRAEGLFFNTVLFKTTVDNTSSLSEHVNAISQEWLKFQSHSQYPLDQVANMLWKEHGVSSKSFCSIEFSYSIKDSNEIQVPSKHAKMPVSIDIHDGSNFLNLSIEWTSGLINEGIIKRYSQFTDETLLHCVQVI